MAESTVEAVQKVVESHVLAEAKATTPVPSLYAAGTAATGTGAAATTTIPTAKPKFGPVRPTTGPAAAPAPATATSATASANGLNRSASEAFELQLTQQTQTVTDIDPSFDLPMPIVSAVAADASTANLDTKHSAPSAAAASSATAPTPTEDADRTETQMQSDPPATTTAPIVPTAATGSASVSLSTPIKKPKLGRLRSVAEVEAEERKERIELAKQTAAEARALIAEHNPNSLGVEVLPLTPEKPKQTGGAKSSDVEMTDAEDALTQPNPSVADDEAAEDDGDEGEEPVDDGKWSESFVGSVCPSLSVEC